MIRRSGRDNILQRADHRLGCEPVVDRIVAGALVLLRALRRLASICLKEVIADRLQ